MNFFFRNSSLLLAFRFRVDGVGFFFFFIEARASFPLVSTEKEKPVLVVKEKEKVIDLPVSIWQKSRHWDASIASSCPSVGKSMAAIFTVYI